jgi:hypothetical protein
VPDDEQAKPTPDPDPGIARGNTARVYNFDVARLTPRQRQCEQDQPARLIAYIIADDGAPPTVFDK